ncbi:TOTE conflict system archaeo-eukaryotic primase domain-containing protein [Oceanisphaera arctica]|uniref:TOTE conflict system archaeo-eukaryotic primase domain-containing protein n=1 Tax=Oceanisphaera arctica TaxID=641510 RepID=UPI0019AE18AB|nr:DEAD/DEAH box helicase [Oceanisphaera arctica]GHA16067.1 DEAD/DEAH box helicase [Oceanisphaera arctica]
MAELEREKAALLARRQELLKATPVATQLTPQKKIELFQGLFRGRADVHAVRWEKANGRSGYAVACSNEWVQGICQKPKIKCGDCPHRQFTPLDSKVLFAHLTGKLVAGLYPLQPDHHCHLLAMDFDKANWQADVKALARVCRREHIPYALEISRSGAGAHLWIFFSAPVPAWSARALGFRLLDKAMELHPGLSFDSYDRLFPNQDMMPQGGFGNLIALPLQYEARARGCSLFVNDELQPYEDQWAFLRELKRVSPTQLQKWVGEPPTSASTDNDTAPWEQGLHTESGPVPGCPERITITLANHVYIKLADIPAPLAARIKRLASFANPVFFKTQALRFSTHGIPRYISCARIEQGYLSVPRGCLDEVIELLRAQSIQVDMEDHRITGSPLTELTLRPVLRDKQQAAVDALTQHDTGILHAPTAFGKTVTAISVIASRQVNTLILTHSRQLLDQWKERLESFLDGATIGVFGGGKKKATGQIDVATYQSLISRKNNSIAEFVRDYGQIIIDECHHISAPRYEMLLNEISARYVLGLTATPNRQDGHQKIMFMTAGPVRHRAQSDQQSGFDQRVIVRKWQEAPPAELCQPGERPHIATVYRWLAENPVRNREIIEDVIASVKQGGNCLLLTERREHAETLAVMLSDAAFSTVVLRGGMSVKERRKVEAILPGAQVVVATGKYIGEGFDLPRLDTLFLALPIAWKGTLAQYAGRLHREATGKQEVTVYDYVDTSLPMLLRMFYKREKGYLAMGYRFVTSEQIALL